MPDGEQPTTVAKHEDPLSPELALVDPELAQRARERLRADAPSPTGRVARPPTAAEESVDVLPAASAPPATPAEASPPPEPAELDGTAGRRRWELGLSAIAGLAALAALGLAFALYWPDVKRNAGLDANGPGSRAASVAANPLDEPAEPPPATVDRPPAPAGPTPRAFGWVPVRNASAYLVEFFQGSRKIFEATTTRTRLTIPARWTYEGRRHSLAPGRYRWTVRPARGSAATRRFDRPIVRAALVVESNDS